MNRWSGRDLYFRLELCTIKSESSSSMPSLRFVFRCDSTRRAKLSLRDSQLQSLFWIVVLPQAGNIPVRGRMTKWISNVARDESLELPSSQIVNKQTYYHCVLWHCRNFRGTEAAASTGNWMTHFASLLRCLPRRRRRRRNSDAISLTWRLLTDSVGDLFKVNKWLKIWETKN